MSLRVLIVGGGIAGPSLAFWLTKLGHQVTILEGAPSLRASGLQLDLRKHGIEVLRKMGLAETFKEKIVPEQGVAVVDEKGYRWGYCPAKKGDDKSSSFSTEWEIMRGDFCKLLCDAAGPDVKYKFGSTLEKIDESDSSVEVTFTDGTQAEYDLVVGAEGVGSKTRKLMLGPDTPDPFIPLDDLYIAYFTREEPIAPGEEYLATMFMGTGRRGVMIRRQSPTHIQVYLGGPHLLVLRPLSEATLRERKRR
jgi:2-polyprenyl-6-methoxyphenol hydroxylase-like FAD-dependent oxidoreductase